MLRLKATGLLKAIAPGIETRGDNERKSVALKFELKDVPLDDVEAGFVSQLSLFYTRNEALKISDIEHEFKVTRAIENVDVDVGGSVKLSGMRVRKVRVKLREMRRADVSLVVIGLIDSGLDRLHDYLRQTVSVTLLEQILKEQQAA